MGSSSSHVMGISSLIPFPDTDLTSSSDVGFTMNFQQYQPQLQQNQQGGQQSINPQLLAFRNLNQQQGQGQDLGNKFPYGGGGFNPAVMMGGGGGSVNPAQLMNGAGGQQQGLNPAIFQQPQQNGSTMGSGMSGMAMGILTREQMQAHFNSMSPHQQQRVKAQMVAATQTHQNPMQTMFQGQGSQGGMGGMGSQGGMSGGMGGVQQGGIGSGGMGHSQQQQQQQAALAHLLAQQQQHLHQHQQSQQPQQHQSLPFGNQQQYVPDRPSSSMSQQSHPQMMPPPSTIPIPPRPPSNMGSRPGTSHSMGGGQQGQQQGMGGPPSRPGTAGGQQQQQGFDGSQGGNPQQFGMNAMNGFGGGPQHQPKPTTPVQFNAPFNIGNLQQQGQGQGGGGGMNTMNPMNTINPQAMFLQQGQGSPPPGSPNQNSAYRGSKRKVGNGMDSPRMSGMGMPSGMQRQISNDGGMGVMQGMNGYPSSGSPAQQQIRPQSVNGHVGLPPAAQNGIGMGEMGGGIGGGMVGGVGVNNLPGGISIGGMSPMNMNVDLPVGRGTSQQPQQQQSRTPMAGFQSQPQQAQGPRPVPPIPQKQMDIGMGVKMPGTAGIGGGNPFGTDLGSIGSRGAVGMGISMPVGNGLPLPSRIPSVAPPPLAKSESSTPTVQPVLPPLPANVQLNPNVTRVSIIPLAGSDKVIPIITSEEIEEIQGWQARDKEYEVIHRKMRERMSEELRSSPAGKANWWEKDAQLAAGMMSRRPREPFDVKYPRPKRDGRDRRKVGRREGLRLPRVLQPEEADRPEQLVPIRLEFDVEHHKMRDSFVWNLNGKRISRFLASCVQLVLQIPLLPRKRSPSLSSRIMVLRQASTKSSSSLSKTNSAISESTLPTPTVNTYHPNSIP